MHQANSKVTKEVINHWLANKTLNTLATGWLTRFPFHFSNQIVGLNEKSIPFSFPLQVQLDNNKFGKTGIILTAPI